MVLCLASWRREVRSADVVHGPGESKLLLDSQPESTRGCEWIDVLVEPHTRYGGGIGLLVLSALLREDDGVLELVVHG